MSDIPTKLYLEILKRVPVESLFRFRSVCKAWRRIIDDPTFSKHHFSRGIGQHWFFHKSQKTGNIFLLPVKELIHTSSDSLTRCVNATYVKRPVYDLDGIRDTLEFPVPSCNGLLLISNSRVIWNPFTGESLRLRPCPFAGPSTGWVYAGIGYDETNDDYRVVRHNGHETVIYSLNSKEWCLIENFPGSTNHCLGRNGVFAYGALHWVACSYEENVAWIAALDLTTEKYHNVLLPSEIAKKDEYFLKDMNGCLSITVTEPETQRFMVWMIKDYGVTDMWIKMVSLEGDYEHITPLAYLKSNDQILLKDLFGDYLWYDLGNKSFKTLGIEVNTDGGFNHNLDGYDRTFTSQVYTASLIRLTRSDASDESIASQGTSKRQRRR